MILAISLFTVAVNILMGLLVYIRNPKGLTNRIFLLFAMLVALWALTNYFSLNGKTAEEALLRIRIVLSVVALMFPMLYLFARNFPAPTLQISQTKLWGVVFFSLFIAAFAFTPFVFSKVNIVDGIITPVAAPGILLYALDVVGFPILTFVFLFKEMRRNAGTVKAQLTFLFFGTAISFTLAIVTNFLFVNIFKFTDLVVLGPFFTLILVGCSAYAIIRHRLLDIRLIIARAVSFLTLIFFLAFVYVFVFLIALGWFFNTRVNTPFFVGTLFFTLAAIFTFQPLENLVRRTTDRFLFEGHYNIDQVLSKLTRIMAETIDLNRMAEALLTTLIKELRLIKAAFLIINDHKIVAVQGVGYQDHEYASAPLENILLHLDHKIKRPIVLEELEDATLKDLFLKLDINVAIPIQVEKNDVAILILGPKASGEIYTEQDIRTIDIFASQAGIAIQNAESYLEIKKFSEKLEQRVFERTAQLEQSQKSELEKANEVARLKDEFVFLATHELKTPIVALQGFLELVSEARKNFPKDIRSHLDSMAEASDHLNQLVSDLLGIARLESKQTALHVSPNDFAPILKNALAELAPLFEEKRLAIKTNVRIIHPVLCDQAKLREILVNLLGNAAKYNKLGGRIQVSAHEYQEKNVAIVEIFDTGVGIPKQHQNRIFEKFFRIRTATTKEILGTGLGLFITRLLVEKMNGKIAFSSVEEKGTTFTFSLPTASIS